MVYYIYKIKIKENVGNMKDFFDDVNAELAGRLIQAAAQVTDGESFDFMKRSILNALHGYEIRRKDYEIPFGESLPDVNYDKSAELMNYFRIIKLGAGRTQGTIEQCEIVARQLVSFINKDLDEITSDDIIFFLVGYQMKNGTKSRTMENKRLLLSSIYGTLQKHNKIQFNPIGPVETIKFKKEEKEPLSDEEIERLKVAVAGDLRMTAIVYILLDCGLRISELCNAKIGDVDFQKRTIKVLGKGNKERTVSFSGKTAVRIEEYLKSRKDLAGIPAGTELALVTRHQPTFKDKPLIAAKIKPFGFVKKNTIEAEMRKLRPKCGIDRLHPHLLRATCATILAQRGVPVEVVAKHLGHANLNTITTYVITKSDYVVNEISKVGGIV